MPVSSLSTTDKLYRPLLVKENVTVVLREKIIDGEIAPGERIVEGKWAAELNVGQNSVREAINELTREGLVTKGAGRSARVIKLSRSDVAHIYEVRAVLEALGARFAAERTADLTLLEQAVDEMEVAAHSGHARRLIEADLKFHLLLAEKSGNPILVEQLRRLLVPLFAFVLIRVNTNKRGSKPWTISLAQHRKILEFIRMGDPALAELFVSKVTKQFAESAFEQWGGESDGVEPRNQP
jgi:DNA-binding GntR family transcriptional regulator